MALPPALMVASGTHNVTNGILIRTDQVRLPSAWKCELCASAPVSVEPGVRHGRRRLPRPVHAPLPLLAVAHVELQDEAERLQEPIEVRDPLEGEPVADLLPVRPDQVDDVGELW
jgi:hypothetical protein